MRAIIPIWTTQLFNPWSVRFLALDDIGTGSGSRIPLWEFGRLY